MTPTIMPPPVLRTDDGGMIYCQSDCLNMACRRRIPAQSRLRSYFGLSLCPPSAPEAEFHDFSEDCGAYLVSHGGLLPPGLVALAGMQGPELVRGRK